MQTCCFTLTPAHTRALELLASVDNLLDRGKPNVSAIVRALIVKELARRARKYGGEWKLLLTDIRAETAVSR